MTTNAPKDQQNSSSRRKWLIAAAVLGVVVVAGVVGLVWYLNQPVPEEVSLESAVAGVTEETLPEDAGTTTTTANTTGGGEASSVGLDGTWTVDTSIGEFSFEEATASFVGFRIDEVLGSIGATQAVGRTPAIEGELTVEGTVIDNVVVEADLTQIVTNNSRRDQAVQRALNTSAFPTATFELIEPIDLGSVPADGEGFATTGTGALTINGITQPIEIPLEGQVSGDLVVVVGSVDITFADWDVAVPSSPAVVSVEDQGPLELQLIFTRS